MALPTLSPDWFTFVPSEQIFDSHKTGRWMRFIFSDYTSCQPSVSILSRYLYSLLPTVFTLSVLPVPHLLQKVSSEWRALVVAFVKQLLTSHFPIPCTHYTDYQYCQSEHPPRLQSRCPTLMWPGGLCWYTDPAFPWDGGRWREMVAGRESFSTPQQDIEAAREQERGSVTAAVCSYYFILKKDHYGGFSAVQHSGGSFLTIETNNFWLTSKYM